MVDYFSLLKTVLLKTRRAYNPGNDEMWNKFQEKVDVVFPDDYKMIMDKIEKEFPKEMVYR